MISIVIPCYNQGQYLLEALASIYQQAAATGAFEVVVVNDSSTDPSTLDILSDLGYSAVVVNTPANLGLAGARNYGIAKASGDWVLPLDADDKLGRNFLARLLETIRDQPEAGIIYGEVEFFGNLTGRWFLPPFSLPQFLLQNSIVSCACFRRSDWQRVGGYCVDFIDGMEDYDFWMSLLELGRRPVKVPEVMLLYRQTGGSMSKRMTVSQRRRVYELLFDRHRALYQECARDLFMQLVDRELGLPRPAPTSFRAQLFFPDGAGHSEGRSIFYSGECGKVLDFTLVIPKNWVGPLRFDPCDCPAQVTLASLKLYSPSGTTLYEFPNGPLAHLELQGTARVGEGGLRAGILDCFGADPQLVLSSHLSGMAGSRLTVRLQVTPSL